MNFLTCVSIKVCNAKDDSMSEEKQQAPIAEKEEHKEGEGDDDASKQEDIRVKVSITTNIPTSENAIEPVVIEDTCYNCRQI